MGRRSLIVPYAAILLGSGGGCTSTVPPLNDGSPQGPTPNYRAIIAKSLTAKTEFYDRSVLWIKDLLKKNNFVYFGDGGEFFREKKKLNHVEFSDTIRRVKKILSGGAWEVCIRLNENNSPATYAVFISDGVV